MKSNISLIGFMGTGKSTVGPILAKKMKMIFIEVDQYLESEIKIPLEKYLLTHEKDFRERERKFCKKLDGFQNTVFSWGGGIILNPKNVENLRMYSFVVLLIAPLDIILDRVLEDKIESRPLLDPENLSNSVQKLLKGRNYLYKKAAHIIIDTAEKTPIEVAKLIERTYHEKY